MSSSVGKLRRRLNLQGTCFGLEALVDALKAEFGDALRDPVQTALLWYYSAQRDFCYRSVMGDYVRLCSVHS